MKKVLLALFIVAFCGKTFAQSKNFYKLFAGNIAMKYSIAMKLRAADGKVSGTYWYSKIGKDLKLSGTIDKYGNITMREFNSEGDNTGIFIGKYKNGVIEGTWSKPDGSKTLKFRVAAIKDLSDSETESNNIAGEYNYETQNTIKSVVIKNVSGSGFYFEISVGTRTACVGSVEGKAYFVSSSKAVFSDGECKLTFIFSPGKVKVVEESLCMEHGAGCAFEGVYYKNQ